MVRTVSYVLSGGDKRIIVPIDPEKSKKELEVRQNGVARGPGNALPQQYEEIPFMLPIWFRRKLPSRYTADDPEWKAFQKVQQDQKLMSEVKQAVMDMVVKEIRKDRWKPSLREVCPTGRILAKYSLYFVPRLYPPAIYEVPCVFVMRDGIRIGWRQLPDHMGRKMDHIFHPVVFAGAFYAGFKVFCTVSYQITQARLTDRFNSMKEPTRADVTKEGKTELPKVQETKTLSETEKTISRLLASKLSEGDKAMWLPFLHGEYGERPSLRPYRDLVKSMTYWGAIEEGCGMFRAKWVLGQRASMQSQIRDACKIEGFVDLIGTRGRVHIDVSVSYSPERDAMVGPLVIHRAYLVPDATRWYNEENGQDAVESGDENTAEPPRWKDPNQPPEAPQTRAVTEGKKKEN